MNSKNQIISEDPNSLERDAAESKDSEILNESTSATTDDFPEFGWSGYAERINGRFAMIGFIAILLVEAFSKDSFLNCSGILPF